jgi:ParB/RepB/Spo0J family partition protein
MSTTIGPAPQGTEPTTAPHGTARADEAPEAHAAPVVVRVPLDHIDPSPTNPRKTFDKQDLRDLAASIAACGLLQPVTVRPHPATAGRYELVAGERRWRAHQLLPIAQRAHIDAIVRDLSDDEVAVIQTVENVQRADVPPIEEGEGFARLLAAGLTPSQVSERVGKSAAHIRQRAALADLIADAKADLVAGRVTVGAALELARVGADAQAEALPMARGDRWSGPASAKRVREHLDREVLLQLARAPFDRRDRTLVPEAGPCTKCPKRTAADGFLFDDFTKKDDRCLDRACFAAKVRAHVAQAIHAAVERMQADGTPEGFRHVYSVCDDYSRTQGRDALIRNDWTPITPDADPRHAGCPKALGVYDARSGAKAGQTVIVCARPQGCAVHYPAHSGAARGDYAAREREKAKATAAERQLLARAVREVVARVPVTPIPEHGVTALPDALLPLIAAQVAHEVQNDPKVTACKILGLDLAAEASVNRTLDPGIYGTHGEGWGATRALVHHIAARATAGDSASVVRVIVVLALTSEAHRSPYSTDRAERIRALAATYGVDLAPLYRDVAAAVAPNGARRRDRLAPEAITLPRCPKCGQESASFLTPVDGACPTCHRRVADRPQDVDAEDAEPEAA